MPERSFLAGAAEPVLRFRASRKKFIEPEACSAYISQMARAARVKYVLPRAARLSGRIAESETDGMQYFTIVPKDSQSGIRVKIAYLHGGSYFAPPNILHWEMLLRLGDLCDAEITVPLYPRAPLRTCSAAYEELLGFFARHKPDVLMGDSAGGGLATGLAQVMGA
ncbi:MAG: alpha/beta hydrolase, partial [Ruminococcus sp.]|nr:alpha/beta hydrolase [Ruminococcus sp.]